MPKIISGDQGVEVVGEEGCRHEQGTWFFCQNGYQSTGVDVSIEQFDMLVELVSNRGVVEFYEKLRRKKNEQETQRLTTINQMTDQV